MLKFKMKWNQISILHENEQPSWHGVEKYITVQCDIQCLIYMTYIYQSLFGNFIHASLSPTFENSIQKVQYRFSISLKSTEILILILNQGRTRTTRPQKFTITGTLDTVPHVLEIIMMKVSRYGLLWLLWWWFLLFEFLFCVEIRALVLHFLCFLCERVWIIINSLE